MKQLPPYLRRFVPLALVLIAALSACSADDGAPGTEVSTNLTAEQEQALIARVEGKWRAMEAWDFAAAYEYTTPNYRRVFSKAMYSNKFGYDVRWVLTGVEVLNYDARAAVASVAVGVMSESTKQTTLASSMGPISDTVREKWFYIDGEWWNSAK